MFICVNFPLPDVLGQTIPKFMVNLHEGRIIDHGSTMVGVIITTLKDPTPPKFLYPTDVILSPQETKTPCGAKALCNQIHTIDKLQIIDFKYKLSPATRLEINKRLLIGIGLIKGDDFLK